jgi:thiamine pyrophosphokinase
VPSAIIVIGGSAPPLTLGEIIERDCFVIAADSGYDHACRLGLPVSLLVGDLDSISETGLAHAVANDIEIERHRPDKDMTDTELALDAAFQRGHDRVTMISGGGDRIDHLLSTVAVIASARFCSMVIELWWGTSTIRVLHGGSNLRLPQEQGGLFSLVAVHGDAIGVTIRGAAFPLTDHVLLAGSSLGISNLVAPGEGACVISVESGTVLVIRPDTLGGQS